VRSIHHRPGGRLRESRTARQDHLAVRRLLQRRPDARLETVETAASYRGPWTRGQRCLQLAAGFYEWHLDDTGRKAPYLIQLNDQDAFAFAGLWDRSFKADGTAIESVAHITMPGNELLRKIHNTGSNPYRMPAILRKEDHEAWLHGTVAEAKAVLQAAPPVRGHVPYRAQAGAERSPSPTLSRSEINLARAGADRIVNPTRRIMGIYRRSFAAQGRILSLKMDDAIHGPRYC
jgi:hypothetical protein